MGDVQFHAQSQKAFHENRNIIGGWGWVMVFSGHFQQYFSYILAVSFYCWRKPEYPEPELQISCVFAFFTL